MIHKTQWDPLPVFPRYLENHSQKYYGKICIMAKQLRILQDEKNDTFPIVQYHSLGGAYFLSNDFLLYIIKGNL